MNTRSLAFWVFLLPTLVMMTSGQRGYGQSESKPLVTQPTIDRLGVWPQRRAVRIDPISLDPLQVSRRALSGMKYPLTPGDCYELFILMETPATYKLILQEDYDLEVPYIGTINVQGKCFVELRSIVLGRLKKTLPLAQFLSFALLSPAQFDVPVFGEVENPGVITVNPLCRVSDVVAQAGGVRALGSIRQIVLVRGERKTVIDLFHYCTDGESGANPYVEPGDSIQVPKAEITVILGGKVNYPGNYELVSEDTLCTLLCYAGGLCFGTASPVVDIIRYDADGRSTELSVDMTKEPNAALRNGDRIRVSRTVEIVRNVE